MVTIPPAQFGLSVGNLWESPWASETLHLRRLLQLESPSSLWTVQFVDFVTMFSIVSYRALGSHQITKSDYTLI